MRGHGEFTLDGILMLGEPDVMESDTYLRWRR